MKAIKIKKAGNSFGSFLIEKDVAFMFYEAYYILNISNIEKFQEWCIHAGLAASDIEQLEFSVVNLADEI